MSRVAQGTRFLRSLVSFIEEEEVDTSRRSRRKRKLGKKDGSPNAPSPLHSCDLNATTTLNPTNTEVVSASKAPQVATTGKATLNSQHELLARTNPSPTAEGVGLAFEIQSFKFHNLEFPPE